MSSSQFLFDDCGTHTPFLRFLNDDSDDGDAPVARDSKKRKQEAESRLGGAMVACRTVLEAVLQKPSIIENPEFLFLREFIYEATENPLVFPPLLPSGAARMEADPAGPILSHNVSQNDGNISLKITKNIFNCQVGN